MIYLEHILEATNGALIHRGKQHRFDTFCHDTRQLIPGEMFVAVRGEQGDGHDYLLDAVGRGAAGLLLEARVMSSLSEETRTALERSGVATVTVADTRIALQDYARYILRRWHPTVIVVTGSTGKTTTKEAIATVLSRNFATFKSWQNYNDLLGLPLSLGRLEERHEYAVLELSCDHPGEISALCRITRPRIGVLTNISPAQLQYFGTVEGLAGELGTLLTSLPGDGAAIVNGDDELIRPLTGLCTAPITTFTPSAVRDVQVTWEGVGARCSASQGPGGEATQSDAPHQATRQLSSHLLGAHHVSTMLAAYNVGTYCGLQAEEVQHALSNVYPLPGRLNLLPGVHGARLLDDTHNAAPAAVMAGLETLTALPGGRRLAILGDRLRPGPFEKRA